MLAITLLAGCSSLSSRATTTTPAASERMSEDERVSHVLFRLTFGPRATDIDRVRAMGVDRWIESQLHPDAIPDTALDALLAHIGPWSGPASVVASLPLLPPSIASMSTTAVMNDSAARAAIDAVRRKLASFGTINDLFYAGRIVVAERTERQLLAVVTDFWEIHFSVFSGKMPSSDALVVWDRDVLRPRAFGTFRDLLGATAHGAAMLYYLDNSVSTSSRLNENYARELLELHTLGVDGGYTQRDVIEVARALTGWTYTQVKGPPAFVFRKEQHDTGTKVVLGHVLPSGRGVEDGEEVLDILARHPSTARHIAFKLARRLVSDAPPPALVARAADTYLRTDGDIAQVVRAIVTSREFFARAAYRAKVKTPLELVVSVRRALDLPPDTTAVTARSIGQLGQPTFGWQAPDGWPEVGDAWMNAGALYNRIKFAQAVARGEVKSAPVERWPDWARLASLPVDAQIEGVVKGILGGDASPATREAMAVTAAEMAAQGNVDGTQRLRALLGIALASPEFERR